MEERKALKRKERPSGANQSGKGGVSPLWVTGNRTKEGSRMNPGVRSTEGRGATHQEETLTLPLLQKRSSSRGESRLLHFHLMRPEGEVRT